MLTANKTVSIFVSMHYTKFSEDEMLYTVGTLWNRISQVNASKVAINTYKDSGTEVRSDIMNSYAWDTAIVFIQECGHTNYANQKSQNGKLANTGKSNDEVCKINDLASNCKEWTSEYSSYVVGILHYPHVNRGGYYGSSSCTANRDGGYAVLSSSLISFRSTLYLIELTAEV